MPPFRFPTAPRALDRLLAAAHATALHVLTSPYGAARLPEVDHSAFGHPKSAPTKAEAYAIGYHAVASTRATREGA